MKKRLLVFTLILFCGALFAGREQMFSPPRELNGDFNHFEAE